MLYIKNGILRDSKKYLQTSDGRTIFSAHPEDWEAEGWKVYVPELQPVYKRTLEEQKLDLLEDAKNYKEAAFNVPYTKEERAYYRQVAEDLLADGEVEAALFDEEPDKIVDLAEFVNYLRDLNIVENKFKKVLANHLAAIEKLETEEELDNYDYTTGYPEVPQFGL